jgi:hypothetical protein
MKGCVCEVCSYPTGESFWKAQFLTGDWAFMCEQCYREYWRLLVRGTVSRFKWDHSGRSLI